jgi:LacI family transcriptional regulator
VLLCNTDEDPAKQREYLEVLAGERVAGVILSPTAGPASAVKDLLDHGISVVAFDLGVRDGRADAVVVANRAGARTGTAHLIECGHRRVGFVGGLAGVETAEQRLAGYIEAVTDAGIEPLVAGGQFRTEGGREAAHALLDQQATALLVANNLMAIGALRAIKERGLRIPGDVAIVSIDDPPWATLTDPPADHARPARA